MQFYYQVNYNRHMSSSLLILCKKIDSLIQNFYHTISDEGTDQGSHKSNNIINFLHQINR